MEMQLSVGELAGLVGGRLSPEAAFRSGEIVTGVGSVDDAGSGDVTFLGNPKYLPGLRQSRAGFVLVPEEFPEEVPPARIYVENPSVAFAKVVAVFSPAPVKHAPGIHPSAVVAADASVDPGASVQAHAVIESGAQVGSGSVIGANCYVGHRVRIGSDCLVFPLVSIREGVILGNRVTIHSGAVIGSDGFGFEFVDGRYMKIPQAGIVQVDDDVEIGANVTIDRARFGKTWIQEGVKIDNLVQIAHNVIVGKHAILVAQVGISGSTKLGNFVTLAGQVGLVGHISLGDGVVVGAQSGVSKDIPAGERWFGSPAVPERDWKRNWVYSQKIRELFERVRALEQETGSK